MPTGILTDAAPVRIRNSYWNGGLAEARFRNLRTKRVAYAVLASHRSDAAYGHESKVLRAAGQRLTAT